MATKMLRYTVVHPDGRVEQMRIPAFFAPYEIAERLRHSLVFSHVPVKQSVYGHLMTGSDGWITGPAVTLVKGDTHYHVPTAPETDAQALHLWRTWVQTGHGPALVSA